MSSTRVADGLNHPVYVTYAPGDDSRLFIVERGGVIKILDLDTGVVSSTPFLTIPSAELNLTVEGGLLGMTFAPDYATSGLIYVNLTNAAGASEIRSYHVSANPDVIDATSSNVIMTWARPSLSHVGGWIGFGPDGYLYIASGDGGFAATSETNPARDPNSLMGKILRIDVNSDAFPADPNKDYAIPAGNPFAGGGGAPEVLAMGLRNPFRASFDPATGHLFVDDVGENGYEEINIILAGQVGQDFGWNILEGTHGQIGTDADALSGLYVPPVVEMVQGSGDDFGGAITGGYVYHGPISALDGMYIFGDFVTWNIWAVPSEELIALAQSGAVNPYSGIEVHNMNLDFTPDEGIIRFIASFGVDAVGNLYVVDYVEGDIFRLDSINNTPPSLSPLAQTVTVQEDAVIGSLANVIEPTDIDGVGHNVRITVTSLPTAGHLTYNGEIVEVGDRIRADELSNVIFTPNLNVTNATANAAARTLGFTFTESFSHPQSATIVFSITPETNDFISGTNNTDTLDGAGGNDIVYGNGGNDFLFGSTGNDTLQGGTGDDFLDGGSGTDTVTYQDATGGIGVSVNLGITTAQAVGGGQGTDTIIGFENLNGSPFGDNLIGDEFANTIAGLDGNDTIDGFNGNDSIFGGPGVDNLYGGDGDDKIYILGNDDFIDGGNGYDQVIVLDTGGVNITIDTGVEYVAGNVGNDIISAAAMTAGLVMGGGDGNDILTGGSGNDTLAGMNGTDEVNGGPGNDLLFAGLGSDNFFGGDGDDKIYILGNDGTIDGGIGFDLAIVLDTNGVTITIGPGIEYVAGNNGNDVLNASALTTALTLGGAEGDDIVHGGSGNDIISGAGGIDQLFGHGGDDQLFAGGGTSNHLYGGSGNDNLTGGAGQDFFHIENGSGNDAVFGFANGTDRFDFTAHTVVNGMGDLVISSQAGGADTLITLAGGGQLYLVGVSSGLIDSSDFLF